MSIKNAFRYLRHPEAATASMISDFKKKFGTRDLIVWMFFLIYLFIGSQIFDDYGVSMDEPIQRKHGIVSFEYVNNQLGHVFPVKHVYNQDIQYYDHRDYGVIFQMVAYFTELSLGLSNSRDVFLLRHLMVFILFWISTIFFFRTIEYHLDDWKLALLGTLFLILSPRIFANSFYNPKDIPLLSWCIISTYTMFKYLDSKKIKYIILHAFACAMAVNTRIVAIYIPAITIGFVMLDWLKKKKRLEVLKSYLTSSMLFILFFVAFTIFLWPFLWSDPIHHFLYSFTSMSHFRWRNSIFFMGDFVYPDNLPWYYIPGWIAISTPILYLVTFLLGVWFVIITTLRNRLALYSNKYERNNLVFLCLFLLPLLAVIILKSTLYNGWRHLYFVYPPLIVISIIGLKAVSDAILNKISNKNWLIVSKGVITCILLFCMSKVVYDIVTMHPHQNVYFNEIAERNASDNFDLDYYGLSFKQGLEKLINNSDEEKINVAYSNFCGMNNWYILPEDLKNRIRETNIDSAEFFITNYHLNAQSTEKIMEKKYPYNQQLIDSIKVKNNVIIGIYRLGRNSDR
ncbi:MAG: ArnT family glycosyltransferase [Bacteroidota bacterium]